MRAVAHEARDDERAVIWAAARKIYAGYEAYAQRLQGRAIPIMVLSAG